MKKLLLFIIALAGLATQSSVYAVGIVTPSGQTVNFSCGLHNGQYVAYVMPEYSNVGDYGSGVNSSYSGLGSLILPSSVVYSVNTYVVIKISERAFYRSNGLTSITIPSTITTFEAMAFYGCSGLTSVYYTGDIAGWCGIDFDESESNPIRYAHKLYINDTLVTNLVVPNSVTEIKQYSFYGATCLTSLTIPNSATSIGGSAFYGCSGLTGSLTIPNSVTSIGYGAFDGCSGFTGSLTIPNSVTSIENYTFRNCSGLTSVTIPNSVTSIGDYAFMTCSGLTSLTIPNSVTSIGASAFMNCSGLTGSLTIPNSVTSIGSYAFYGCSGLTSLTIPNSVTSIGYDAFDGCSGLTEIHSLNPNPPTLQSSSFFNVPRNIPVYIPCGSLSAYSSDQYWSTFTNLIESGSPEFTARSADASMGTAQILTMPSCTSTQAVVSASPKNRFMFDHWSDGSTQNPYTLDVTDNMELIAYFVPIVYHTVTVRSDNTTMGRVSGGGSYAENTQATITATANNGYRFTNWNDGCTETSRTFTVTCDTAFTAYFEAIPIYTVTVNSNDDEMGTVTGGGTYYENTQVTVTATANDGYRFTNWNDGSTEASRTFTVTCDSVFTAYFEVIPIYTVTVNSNDDEMGTVTGGGTYLDGTQVTITATPNDGCRFISWNDGSTETSRTITVTADITYTAIFEAIPYYTITVLSNDEEMGSVTGGGTFLDGTQVTITATANNGYRFINWSDGSTEAARTVTVTSDATYTAIFEAIPTYTITVLSNDDEMGTVTGGGTYVEGSHVIITATPNDGYRFLNWNDGKAQPSRTITVTCDTTFTAVFEYYPWYTITVNNANPEMGVVGGGGTYYVETQVTISATANEGYRFTHWDDGSTQAFRTITVTGNATYTANFATDSEQPSSNAPSIACVSVDRNNHNIVRWESRAGLSVVRYNIYRNGLEGFTQVGHVDYNGASDYSWVDDNSNTASQAYTYRISEVYGNGNESELSAPHTTMHLQISQGQGNTWNLSWTPYQGFNYNGYRVYSGTSADNMRLITTLAASNTTYSDLNGTQNTYYQIEVVPSSSKNITVVSRSNIASAATPTTYMLYVYSADLTMGTTSGGGIYNPGEQAIITATAFEGYRFTTWSDGNTQASRTITVTADATYTAYFEVGGIEGIDDIAAEEVRIYARGNEIIIEGAEDSETLIYDVMGRIIHKGRIESPISVSNAGVYMVKIGDRQPQKVVVR